MKTLSYWASHHIRLAIFLIIVGEVINAFNGILLGSTLLNKLPLAGLYAYMLVMIGLAFSIQSYATQVDQHNYWLVRRWVFMAFLSNFLLFGFLGGIWDKRTQTIHPSASVLGSRRISVVRDSVSSADSVRLASSSVSKKEEPTSGRASSPRAIYIVLGIVGLVVAYALAGLACNLTCSQHGFLALLAFYLGLGGVAGSFYFFSKAAQRSPKRRRDMTADERRRDGRRFWLSWLILIGIGSVALLFSAGK